ncbi:response regulator [Roseomonas sp. OT10]|uniref:hybrid sensor histidine kinase/response regulator n=1 Tax=Roseomonas cutis TaxID=2897332 RepID=UPI001E407A33|nr:response regulator [Roseomonas sp. OT10]UFN49954.1 response regulator [Roseomonas sp. OT10]
MNADPYFARSLADMLDGLEVAAYLLDDSDRAVLWNRTFLRFFPEHDGRVSVGEPYAENLRRFYSGRLEPGEMGRLEQYVADGIARHRAQDRPFCFSHHGRWLLAACLSMPGVGRMRTWKTLRSPGLASPDWTPPEAVPEDVGPLLHRIADGMLVRGDDGRTVSVNEQFLALYGLDSAADAIGHSFQEILDTVWHRQLPGPEEARAREACVSRLLENGRFTGAPFEVPLPWDRWVRVVERRDADGRILATHSDISDLKRQQRETAEARDAAARASQAKSVFLAMMSHEIRTPMNGILGMTSLLLETPLDEVQRGYAEAAQKSASALLTIINDVLDVSKLEAGKLRLEAIVFDLAELAEDAVALLAPRARQRGLELSCRIDPTLRRAFIGDPTRLRQVLLNLLSNAVKFTSEGRVEVALLPDEAQPGQVRFEVLDTGIGFEPAVAGRLFDMFEQADGSIARRFGGTGLGLSISRHLVELMGGRIGAESRGGGGSRFWFSVPLEPASGVPALAVGAAPVPGLAAPAEPREVLVVEDNPTNQIIAETILRKAGFQVRVAVDGASALACVSASWPDLILMDLQLPDMDGYEVTRRIRAAMPFGRTLPIIALTASAMEEDRQRCLDGGMDDYLTKPFKLPALLAAVDRWLAHAAH